MARRRVVYEEDCRTYQSRPRLGWLGTQVPAPPVVDSVGWLRRVHRDPDFEPPPPLPVQLRERPQWLGWLFSPTPGPTPLSSATAGKPVVARQPSKADAARQKRAFDRLADVFNALGTAGVLLQVGPHDWVVRPRIFEETHPPGVTNDVAFGAYPGDTWVDTAGQTVWTCVKNTAGAAVWKQTA